ncbi:hypothetical protein A3715_17220 [Oleiphilus sp. HI0009]|nr:hypothetical protein A3715_17220 [Oleiphilus sp. HI0009]
MLQLIFSIALLSISNFSVAEQLSLSESSISTGNENAPYQVNVFTTATCPACKHLFAQSEIYNDKFNFIWRPVLADSYSDQAFLSIFNSKDIKETFINFMDYGFLPDSKPVYVPAIGLNSRFMQQLGFTGTPSGVVVSSNGDSYSYQGLNQLFDILDNLP